MSVKLYKRKIYSKEGKYIKTSLYFDYYLKGQTRSRRCINHYLIEHKKFTKENNKTIDEVSILLIQENKKLQQTKSISQCIERENHISLLNYLSTVIEHQKGNTLYDNLYTYLQNYLKSDINLKNIDRKWIEKFRLSLLQSKLSINSARAYYLKLKTLLNKAVREGLIENTPVKNVDTIKPQSVKREFLTIDEIEKIAALPGGRYELIKRAFLFSCFTGLRRRSVCNLLYEEINNNKIQRFDEKTGDYEYFDLSKTAQKILTSSGNIYNATGRVFEGLNYVTMTRDLKRFIAPLKIRKNITFHTARHSYATMLITQGADLYTVSKLLGHADIQTTQIYANIINDVRKNAVNSLPVLEIKEG